MALIALSYRSHSYAIEEEVLPAWEEAINEMQARTLNTDREVLERFSLGWLLANQAELFDHVFVDSLDSMDPDEPLPERPDPETTRDWFCWLHREMISRAKENQLQEQNEQRQFGCIGA